MKKALTICLAVLSGIIFFASVSLASTPPLSKILIEKEAIRWNVLFVTKHQSNGTWSGESFSLHSNVITVLDITKDWVEVQVHKDGLCSQSGKTYFLKPESYAEHMNERWMKHKEHLSFSELKNEYDSIFETQPDSLRLMEIANDIDQLVIESWYRLTFNVRSLDEAQIICLFQNWAFDFCQEITQRIIEMPCSVFAKIAERQFLDIKRYGDEETLRHFAQKLDDLVQKYGSTEKGSALQKEIELYLSQFDS